MLLLQLGEPLGSLVPYQEMVTLYVVVLLSWAAARAAVSSATKKEGKIILFRQI